MPIYEYRCANCKLQFELKQGFADDPVACCPTCYGVAHRLFLPVPLLFKGPGFYITDSRMENDGKKLAKAPSDAAEKSRGES